MAFDIVQRFTKDEATAARRRMPVFLVDVTDGFTPETGIAMAAGEGKVSKNGAAEVNAAGTLTHVATGVYYYEFTAGELDTLGWVYFKLIDAAARQFVGIGNVVAYDQYDAVQLGLTGLVGPEGGTVQAGGGSTSIKLDASASAVDDFYNDTVIFLLSGTGARQAAFITDYVGATLTATINGTWTTLPDTTTKYVIIRL